MNWYQALAVLVVIVCLVLGFFVGKSFVPAPTIIERNITQYLPLDCPVCPVCPVCPECITTTTIERQVTIPCPECKCDCKLLGGYAQDKVWWYQDNTTIGETP